MDNSGKNGDTNSEGGQVNSPTNKNGVGEQNNNEQNNNEQNNNEQNNNEIPNAGGVEAAGTNTSNLPQATDEEKTPGDDPNTVIRSQPNSLKLTTPIPTDTYKLILVRNFGSNVLVPGNYIFELFKDGGYVRDYTVTIGEGEASGSLEIPVVPGRYAVIEKEPAPVSLPNFWGTPKYSPEEVVINSDNLEGTITVTNTVWTKPGSVTYNVGWLKIEKVAVEGVEDGEFNFTVTNVKDPTDIKTATVHTEDGFGSYTIELKPGEYMVVEEEGNYEASYSFEGAVQIKASATTTVKVTNNPKKPPSAPPITIHLEKLVKDADGQWVSSASFEIDDDNPSIDAEYKIVVALDADKLLAFYQENEITEFSPIVARGYVKDSLEGGQLDLPDDGEFELYYINSEDNMLVKEFDVAARLTNAGTYVNTASLDPVTFAFEGADKANLDEGSEAVVILENGDDDDANEDDEDDDNSGSGGNSGGGNGTGADLSSGTMLVNNLPVTIAEVITPLDETVTPDETEEELFTLVGEESPLGDTVISEESVTRGKIPQTRDNGMIYLWLAGLLSSSILAAVLILVSNRKKRILGNGR